jgi:hypothetical protein
MESPPPLHEIVDDLFVSIQFGNERIETLRRLINAGGARELASRVLAEETARQERLIAFGTFLFRRNTAGEEEIPHAIDDLVEGDPHDEPAPPFKPVVGDNVQFYGPFGHGPYAAIVTRLYPDTGAVDLTVFAPGDPPNCALGVPTKGGRSHPGDTRYWTELPL